MEQRETGIGWGMHGKVWIYVVIDGRMGLESLEEGKLAFLFNLLSSVLVG